MMNYENVEEVVTEIMKLYWHVVEGLKKTTKTSVRTGVSVLVLKPRISRIRLRTNSGNNSTAMFGNV
jgi:hypothetical protein